MRKTLFLFILALLLPNTFTLATELDGQEGHGGDAVAYEFIETARQVADSMELTGVTGPTPDFPRSLRTAIQSTMVRSDESVSLGGFEVDAANYPKRVPALILINRTRWAGYTNQYRKKRILAIHEYLSIMGLSDTRYELSSGLIARLEMAESKVRGRSQELAVAIRNCDMSAFERLMADAYDFGVRFDGGDTALHIAAGAGCPVLVGRFLQLGMNPNALNELGWSPLFSAVWHFHYANNPTKRDLYRAVIRSLLDNGANVNLNTASTVETTLMFPMVIRTQQTPLIRAMMGVYDLDAPGMYLHDDPELVDQLFASGADVNQYDGLRLTPLHHAVALGRLDYVSRLLEKGADPNLRNERFETPLDLAAASQDRLHFLPYLMGSKGKPSDLTLLRILSSMTNLNQETLVILERVARFPGVEVNLGLRDAVKLSYRLATQRGLKDGHVVMQILVKSPNFDPSQCTPWMVREELGALTVSRFAEYYRPTYQVINKALQDLKQPEDCNSSWMM